MPATEFSAATHNPYHLRSRGSLPRAQIGGLEAGGKCGLPSSSDQATPGNSSSSLLSEQTLAGDSPPGCLGKRSCPATIPTGQARPLKRRRSPQAQDLPRSCAQPAAAAARPPKEGEQQLFARSASGSLRQRCLQQQLARLQPAGSLQHSLAPLQQVSEDLHTPPPQHIPCSRPGAPCLTREQLPVCSRQLSAAPYSAKQLSIPPLCGPSGLQHQHQQRPDPLQAQQQQQQQQLSQYARQDPSLTLLLLQHKQAQVTAAAVAAAKLGRSGSTGLDQPGEQIPAAWSLQPAYSAPVRSATTSALQYTHLWHARLRLQQGDTIGFTLHLWQRLRDWVSNVPAWQRRYILAGCFWVASKFEETRRGIPSASRMAAVVGVTVVNINALEICVLKAAAWSPLAGWDDSTHSKGQLCSPYEPTYEEFPA